MLALGAESTAEQTDREKIRRGDVCGGILHEWEARPMKIPIEQAWDIWEARMADYTKRREDLDRRIAACSEPSKLLELASEDGALRGELMGLAVHHKRMRGPPGPGFVNWLARRLKLGGGYTPPKEYDFSPESNWE